MLLASAFRYLWFSLFLMDMTGLSLGLTCKRCVSLFKTLDETIEECKKLQETEKAKEVCEEYRPTLEKIPSCDNPGQIDCSTGGSERSDNQMRTLNFLTDMMLEGKNLARYGAETKTVCGTVKSKISLSSKCAIVDSSASDECVQIDEGEVCTCSSDECQPKNYAKVKNGYGKGSRMTSPSLLAVVCGFFAVYSW